MKNWDRWYCVFCEIASGITFEPWHCIFYFKNRSCSGCSMYQQYSTFSNFRALRAKVRHNGANSDCNRLENCLYLVTVEIKAIEFYIGMFRMFSIIQQKKRLQSNKNNVNFILFCFKNYLYCICKSTYKISTYKN